MALMMVIGSRVYSYFQLLELYTLNAAAAKLRQLAPLCVTP